MSNKSYTKMIVPTVYVLVVIMMSVSIILILQGVTKFINEKTTYKYTLDNVFEDVVQVGKTNSDSIIRPYIDDGVSIYKYFYDYEADEKSQESSLIVYENTYLQNSGVDYVSDDDFDVVSILDGEIINIEESDIYGKIITIKHNDNLMTVYSSVKDVLVSKGYKVTQGEIIATASKSKLNDKNSTLHFEVYYKNEVIDPENLYTLSIEDFR